jgi:putative copper export protein
MEAAVAIARGAHFLAVLSVLGACVARVTFLRAALRGVDGATRARATKHQRAWLGASLGAAIFLGLVWLIVQSARIADATGVADIVAAIPVVLTDTVFGHALLLRLGLLALTAVSMPFAGLAAIVSAATAAEQIGMGHAIASGGFLLPISVGLHVTAAGIWLGGLIPLGLLIRDLPGDRARVAAMRFSPIGLGCVVVLAGTALVQGETIVGGTRGLIESEYGHVAALKLGLFAVLIACAVINRVVLAPRADIAPRPLLRNLSGEVLVGILVVFAAAYLSQQMPGMDM